MDTVNLYYIRVYEAISLLTLVSNNMLANSNVFLNQFLSFRTIVANKKGMICK